MSEDAPAKKPGYKTTEFWITAVLTLAGLVVAGGYGDEDSPMIKIAGMALSLGAAMGYTIVRGGVKKAAKVLLMVLLPFMIVSCCKGHVRAEGIHGLVHDVTERHDNFIKGEATEADKDPRKKDSHLRSSEILRKIVDEAKQ